MPRKHKKVLRKNITLIMCALIGTNCCCIRCWYDIIPWIRQRDSKYSQPDI